jgi:hypothetical protein
VTRHAAPRTDYVRAASPGTRPFARPVAPPAAPSACAARCGEPPRAARRQGTSVPVVRGGSDAATAECPSAAGDHRWRAPWPCDTLSARARCGGDNVTLRSNGAMASLDAAAASCGRQAASRTIRRLKACRLGSPRRAPLGSDNRGVTTGPASTPDAGSAGACLSPAWSRFCGVASSRARSRSRRGGPLSAPAVSRCTVLQCPRSVPERVAGALLRLHRARGSNTLGPSCSPASAWLTRCPPKIDGRKPTPLQPRLYSSLGCRGWGPTTRMPLSL